MSSMNFIQTQGSGMAIRELFNEQHAAELISQFSPNITTLSFTNVGVKVMRSILAYFQESPLREVSIDYNWNSIMTTPHLVCYDKNQWKTLQQLNNWNREWRELFTYAYALEKLSIRLHCSWMDDQFTRQFLEGVAKVPNISLVHIKLASKNKAVENMLAAFSQAKVIPQFAYEFKLLQ